MGEKQSEKLVSNRQGKIYIEEKGKRNFLGWQIKFYKQVPFGLKLG